MPEERVHPAYQPVTSHVRDLLDTIEVITNEPDTLKRLALVARELQPMVGYLLRDLTTDCVSQGVPWREMAEAADTKRGTLNSQYAYGNGGPMIGNHSKTNYRHRQPRRKPDANPGQAPDALV